MPFLHYFDFHKKLPKPDRHWLLLVAGAGLSLSLASCHPKPEATLGYAPFPTWSLFEYSQAAGIQQKIIPGLKIQRFNDIRTSVNAYINGTVDILTTTSINALAICGRAPDRCPVIILILDESRGADEVVVASGVDPSQADSIRIGLEDSLLTRYLLERAHDLQAIAETPEQQISQMSPEALTAAFKTGSINSAVTYPPYSGAIRKAISTRQAFSSRSLPLEIIDVLVVSPQLLRREPAITAQVARLWLTAAAEASPDSSEGQHKLAPLLGSTPQEVAAMARGLALPGPQEQHELLNPEHSPLNNSLRAVRTEMVDLGWIPSNTPLPALNPQAAITAFNQL